MKQVSEQAQLRAPQLYRTSWFPVEVNLEDAPSDIRMYVADRNKIEIPPQFYRTTVGLWMGYVEKPQEVWFLHPSTMRFEPVSHIEIEPMYDSRRTLCRLFIARYVFGPNPFTFTSIGNMPIYVVWGHQPESHH